MAYNQEKGNEFIGDLKKLSGITKDTDISELIEKLKTGVNNIMNSSNYQNYLNYMTSFYDYSVNNVLLIIAQKPDASMIGSYGFWKQKNRYVRSGEHGIKIIAPITAKREKCIPKSLSLQIS